MLQRIIPATLKTLSAVVLASQLFGCIENSGDSGSASAPTQTVISGSVGDGPIVGATLNIYDKDGHLIQTETSDVNAGYSARIKAKGNAYPLTIEAVNGTDLVTGRAPDFRLVSAVLNPSVKQVNINPFTTLIVESARSMTGGLNEQNIADAGTAIVNQLNFGLDPALIADPIGTEIDDNNVADAVKASETLGEMIRRTRDILLPAGAVDNTDEVVRALADDMSDGILDGLGGNHASTRVTAVAIIASAQVLIESLSNNLRVDGSIATDVLNNAVLTIRPTAAGSGLTANVTVNSEMLEQARTTVAAARVLAPVTELKTIADILDTIQSGSLPSEIEPVLPGDSSQDLDPVITLATTATNEQLAAVNDALYPAAPALTLTASPASITQGDSLTLSWDSTDVTSCSASGSWTGSKAPSGSQSLTNLTADQTYTLTCTGAGGSVTRSVSVSVTEAPDTTAPSVPTGLSATVISTSQIDLNWNASTDDTGVTGYSLYRNGIKVATTTSTAYSNVSLAAGTTYTFAVSAFDAAGNSSAQSGPVSSTTAVSAPTATLAASPSSIIAGQSATLSWSTTDATSCSASGGWSGARATAGSQTLAPTASVTYTLTCNGTGGSVTKSVAVTVTTSSVSFNGKPDWAGVWGIGGGESYSTANRPWYKGTVLSVNWRDIEPADNSFDFSPLDRKIQQAVANGLYVMPMVYHGHLSPEWIYSAGVTPVLTQNGATYPYYLDPDFMYYVSRMINMVAAHLQSLPKEQRDRIVGVQAPQGTIGDPMPYLTDPVDSQYIISSTDWQAYEREIFAVYANAYDGTNPPIVPLFKASKANEAWLQDTYPVSWRKTNLVAQMYQLNAETNSGKIALSELLFGSEGNIRARGEFGNAVEIPAGWFTEAPVWNVYWNCLWMLTYGLDIYNQRPVLIENYQPHVEAFSFFTNHAGNKVPGQSGSAWIALHDGLDVSDKSRFPEAQYGPYSSGTNPDRYAAIAAAFSAYGARQGDPAHQADQALTAIKQTEALNDVGNKIWTDNYGVYLRQIDPLGTSQGYWRVGPTDQPYGRFARGFQHASGKDRMDFDIDDRFFDNQPLQGKYPVTIRVVYFDKGVGQWSLQYDAVGDSNKTALTVAKTDSGLWKEVSVTVDDAYFGNRSTSNSDIVLTSDDTEDDIFHMIEVTR